MVSKRAAEKGAEDRQAHGIGTMFSLAVLSAMVSIALSMVVRVATAFWSAAIAGGLMGMNFTDGMTSQAMQQGGLGLILTTLIITAPPMAASFFQGTMGHFNYSSAFQQGPGSANGRTPGAPGYIPSYTPQAPSDMTRAPADDRRVPASTSTFATETARTTGARGLARSGNP